MNEAAGTSAKWDSTPGDTVASGAQRDPLTELEKRWSRLADTIQNLREEKAILQEQLQEQEERIFRMEQEAATKAEELVALNEEKRRTIARIESLLSRFDDAGQ